MLLPPTIRGCSLRGLGACLRVANNLTQGSAQRVSSASRPGQLGFMLYEILSDAGYSLDEIKEVSAAIVDHAEHGSLLKEQEPSTGA